MVYEKENEVQVDIPTLGTYSISTDIELPTTPAAPSLFRSSACKLASSASFVSPAPSTPSVSSDCDCPSQQLVSSSYIYPPYHTNVKSQIFFSSNSFKTNLKCARRTSAPNTTFLTLPQHSGASRYARAASSPCPSHRPSTASSPPLSPDLTASSRGSISLESDVFLPDSHHNQEDTDTCKREEMFCSLV